MSIDPTLQKAVDRTKAQVEVATMPDDSKERLCRIIDRSANATNGTPDKIQIMAELMLESILLQAHDRATEPLRVSDIVDTRMQAHTAACPLRADPARALPRWAAAIYPFRWQLMVIASFLCFSPYLPTILKLGVEHLPK